MSDGRVITEMECSAKDGWNLANLGSPLYLLGGHRFLLVSTPRWSGRRVFQHQREISCNDEFRRFLNHFLAKCSMADRPGLDVWAGFGQKPSLRIAIPSLSASTWDTLHEGRSLAFTNAVRIAFTGCIVATAMRHEARIGGHSYKSCWAKSIRMFVSW